MQLVTEGQDRHAFTLVLCRAGRRNTWPEFERACGRLCHDECQQVLIDVCNVLQDALIRLDDREAEEARQKEAKKREAEAALKVGPVLPSLVCRCL